MYRDDKIKLRGFNKEDASKLVEMRNDFEGVKAFCGSPFPVNLQTEERWIESMYPPGLKASIYFAVEAIDSLSLVGYCVARQIDYINRNALVGTLLFEEFRGKGKFKRISNLFYRYLFNEINLHKVYTYILKDNIISLESHKKIGFKVEGEVREHIYQTGVYKDVCFLSLYSKGFMNVGSDE